MTQADRVLSTPPTNTPIDTTRRGFLAQAAAVAAGGVVFGVALPLPGSVGASERVPDPILDVIERHRTARADWMAAVRLHSNCEEEIARDRRQSNVTDWEESIVETDDPRWIAAEENTLQTSDDMDDRACDLVNIKPTTIAGLAALLVYVATVEK